MASSIFKELRQRKIFRGAGLYVLVAWIVLQAGEIVFPALGLPDWTLKLVIVLLGIGFPIALVLAWMFEVTPEGIKRDSEVDHSARAHRGVGRAIDYAIIGVLMVAVFFFGYDYVNRRDDSVSPSVDAQSIAVLPFVNMSGDPENDYFSDGVTEELLNALAKIPGLKVAGRTSSFAFKNKTDDLRYIGEQLGVDTVLEGSVRRDGEQVRVTAQLVSTLDGFHLWSDTFDYRLDDIFAIQDDIARAVVKQLKGRLLGGDELAAHPPTVSPAAHQAYLRGRYEIHRRVEESVKRAGQFFQEAVDLDHEYSDAWVGLAESYILRYSNHRLLPKDEAVAKADAAIRRALELNPNSAEAHAALGLIRIENEEFDEARIALDRALKLNPNYAEAWHWYGLLDRHRGSLVSSHEKFSRAIELDPLHPVARANLGQNLLLRGKLEEAQAFFERSIELDPEYPNNYLLLGLLAAHRPFPDTRDALAWAERALALSADDPDALAFKSSQFLALGDPETSQLIAAQIAAERPHHPNAIFGTLAGYLYTGDEGAAISYLDNTVASGGAEIDDIRHQLAAIAHMLKNEHAEAIAAWIRSDQKLVPESLSIDESNYRGIVFLAWSYIETGQAEQADLMLDALAAYIEGMPRFGPKGIQLVDVEIAVLRGDHDGAIALLEAAVAAGYRHRLVRNTWSIADYPLFEPLLTDQRFVDLVSVIEQHSPPIFEDVQVGTLIR